MGGFIDMNWTINGLHIQWLGSNEEVLSPGCEARVVFLRLIWPVINRHILATMDVCFKACIIPLSKLPGTWAM